MAQQNELLSGEGPESSTGTTTADASGTASEDCCPICLLTHKFPVVLPCGHIFCFLCVKGVAYKNRRCAMCRREIPPEFLDRPRLVNGVEDIRTTKSTEDGYQWFYEGRNGWWQYDDRTSTDIEDAYKKSEKICTILVAGNVYVVDLETMLQQRQNEPSRCRRVKRDLANVPKKGVAGLRIEGNTVTSDSNYSTAAADAAIRIAADIIDASLVIVDAAETAMQRSNITANSAGNSTLNGENDSMFVSARAIATISNDGSTVAADPLEQLLNDFNDLQLPNMTETISGDEAQESTVGEVAVAGRDVAPTSSNVPHRPT